MTAIFHKSPWALLALAVLGLSCASIPGDPPYRASAHPGKKAVISTRGIPALDSLLADLSEASVKTGRLEAPELRQWLTDIKARYYGLDRTVLSHQDFMELKFAWLNFDRLAFEGLSARLVSGSPARIPDWFAALGVLPFIPDSSRLAPLAACIKSLPASPDRQAAASAFATYLAGLGDARLLPVFLTPLGISYDKDARLSLGAGPGIFPGFNAGHMSGEPFASWSVRPVMAGYTRSNGTVIFKGQSLEVGDLFLVQEQNDSESLFTSPSDAESFVNHVGTYVEPLVDGRKVPSIYEAYEAGVRLVPLNEWLGRDFITYGEHYRIDSSLMHPGWQQELSANALAMTREPHGYDIMSPTVGKGGDRYANCVSAATWLFSRTGITLPHRDSAISGKAGTNLESLGVILVPVPAPEGLAALPAYRMVGCIDNDFAFLTLARDLVGSRFHDWLHRFELVIKPEGNYGFYRWGLRLVASNDPCWKPFLLDLFGFTADTAPDGPPDLSALVLTVQDSINGIMHGFYGALTKALSDWDFSGGISWTQIQADPGTNALMDRHMTEIRTWFKTE